MAILRAKTINLKTTRELSQARKLNSELNEQEALRGECVLQSFPRRLVFEMTNTCNLNCVMCGRNAADFTPAFFNKKWLDVFEPIVDKVEEVTLMGWGEPTVHPGFLEFLQWAHKRGLRKYFCTNGVRLGEIKNDIFDNEVDIIAISVDAASAEKNNAVRRGMNFEQVVSNIKSVTEEKKRRETPWPHMNFVLTAMRSNIADLPGIVQLANDVGLNEVKVVYLTAFEESLRGEVLLGCNDEISVAFAKATELASSLGVDLKLPHLPGDDEAGDAYHKSCYTAWRDFFIGSDGYVRPCMSTPEKFFSINDFNDFESMWNSPALQKFRASVNCENMSHSCKHCYQSSFANWNKKEAFIQIGEQFSPDWI